ncbi:MAG: dTDP-glucose 4,6-dehydratase [Atopobiaceae bacterium]|jgi:dTDP-glucose 4,6-dehydratase
MHTYLVTGGAGFIGSNFILYMLKKHDDIRIVNVDVLTYAGNLENLASVEGDKRLSFVRADIRDRAAITRVFEEYQPDYVVNFAAESHVDRSIETPGIFADTNVMGTVNMLNCARAAWETPDGFGAHRFLQVGTDEVYGTLQIPRELNENGSPAHPEDADFFYETTPLSPHSPYSASKASADMFVKAYHDTFGMPTLITRCSNNYGPYQFPEKLIPLMIHNCLMHRELPVYGDGLNVRDWLYVDDHCKAIDMVISGGRTGEVYNIGGHNERANIYIVKTIIKEVARITQDSAINEDLIAHVSDRKGHDRRYGMAPDKIKAELGWYPETPYEVGIVKTIRWYLDNAQWVDNVTSGAYQDYYDRMYKNR